MSNLDCGEASKFAWRRWKPRTKSAGATKVKAVKEFFKRHDLDGRGWAKDTSMWRCLKRDTPISKLLRTKNIISDIFSLVHFCRRPKSFSIFNSGKFIMVESLVVQHTLICHQPTTENQLHKTILEERGEACSIKVFGVKIFLSYNKK